MTLDPIDQTPVNPPASDSTEIKQVDQKKYKKIRGWLNSGACYTSYDADGGLAGKDKPTDLQGGVD